MKTNAHILRLSVLAASLASVFAQSAYAQTTDEIARLTTLESRVAIGIGVVTHDNQQFGRYTGMQDNGAYGIADIDIVNIDKATGTWINLRGRDLGLDNREFNAEYLRQGDWGLSLDYSAIPSFSPYTINTGLQGIGTNSLTVQSTGKRDVVLNTERERISLGGQKSFGNGWSAQVRFTNEEKDGARIFGRGTTGGTGNFNFLAEPIDSTTTQFEGLVSYDGDRFQAQGGYYGTFFNSRYTDLKIAGGGTGLNGVGAGTFSPIGLPPGNQAHQLNLSGGYTFGPTTRGSFKVAYTSARQDDDFVGNPPGVVNSATTGNITGRRNLGGRVDTTLVFLGLNSRPIPKLTLLANFRYEDRDDKTPVARYIDTTATSNHDGTNEVRSFRSTSTKLEASYQLPAGYRAVAGLDHEIKERSSAAQRVVSHRDETRETALRVELRRSLSETLNGSLAYIRSDRSGSDFLFNTRFDRTNSTNLIAPIHLADRERDRVKLGLDWAPTDALSLQFGISETRDSYSTRFDLGLGIRDGRAHLVSIDAAYSLSENWKLTGWTSYADTRVEQRSGPNAAASPATPTAGAAAITNLFDAGLHDKNDAVGLGLRGKLMGKLDIGADLQFLKDVSEYRQTALTGPAIAALPNVEYKTTTLRLFGSYALQRNAGVQVDLVHDRRRIDDWTWRNFVYTATTAAADGTSISQNPTEKTSFIGISGYYTW